MVTCESLPPVPAPLQRLLPDEVVAPRYGGASIANLPASIGHLLGVQGPWSGPGLVPDLQSALAGAVDRVVLLLVDGVGWERLNTQLACDDGGFSALLERYGVLKAPLTTVSPATTCVATTTVLGNGATPLEHGMLGFTFMLPGLGLIANMLFWHPAWKRGAVHGELETWGLAPETFLPTPSVAEVLGRAAIPTRVIMPSAYSHSPLSRMRPRGAEIDGFVNATDMWLKLGAFLEDTAGSKAYAYAYYADFDTLSHRDSPDGAFWEPLWFEFAAHLKRFIAALSAAQRRNTLFLITSDHGHVTTPRGARVAMQAHPALLELCSAMPGGEARHVYLYAKAERKADLLTYARTHLSDSFHVLDTAEAIAAGLYGDPARRHPEAARRLGDVALLAKGPHYFWDDRDDKRLLGMHSSLEPSEMIVPLIGLRFD